MRERRSEDRAGFRIRVARARLAGPNAVGERHPDLDIVPPVGVDERVGLRGRARDVELVGGAIDPYPLVGEGGVVRDAVGVGDSALPGGQRFPDTGGAGNRGLAGGDGPGGIRVARARLAGRNAVGERHPDLDLLPLVGVDERVGLRGRARDVELVGDAIDPYPLVGEGDVVRDAVDVGDSALPGGQRFPDIGDAGNRGPAGGGGVDHAQLDPDRVVDRPGQALVGEGEGGHLTRVVDGEGLPACPRADLQRKVVCPEHAVGGSRPGMSLYAEQQIGTRDSEVDRFKRDGAPRERVRRDSAITMCIVEAESIDPPHRVLPHRQVGAPDLLGVGRVAVRERRSEDPAGFRIRIARARLAGPKAVGERYPDLDLLPPVGVDERVGLRGRARDVELVGGAIDPYPLVGEGDVVRDAVGVGDGALPGGQRFPDTGGAGNRGLAGGDGPGGIRVARARLAGRKAVGERHPDLDLLPLVGVDERVGLRGRARDVELVGGAIDPYPLVGEGDVVRDAVDVGDGALPGGQRFPDTGGAENRGRAGGGGVDHAQLDPDRVVDRPGQALVGEGEGGYLTRVVDGEGLPACPRADLQRKVGCPEQAVGGARPGMSRYEEQQIGTRDNEEDRFKRDGAPRERVRRDSASTI